MILRKESKKGDSFVTDRRTKGHGRSEVFSVHGLIMYPSMSRFQLHSVVGDLYRYNTSGHVCCTIDLFSFFLFGVRRGVFMDQVCSFCFSVRFDFLTSED